MLILTSFSLSSLGELPALFLSFFEYLFRLLERFLPLLLVSFSIGHLLLRLLWVILLRSLVLAIVAASSTVFAFVPLSGVPVVSEDVFSGVRIVATALSFQVESLDQVDLGHREVVLHHLRHVSVDPGERLPREPIRRALRVRPLDLQVHALDFSATYRHRHEAMVHDLANFAAVLHKHLHIFFVFCW